MKQFGLVLLGFLITIQYAGRLPKRPPGLDRVKLLMLWRLLRGEGPPCLAEHMPQTVAQRSSRCLRNPNSLAFPYSRSSKRCQSFLPSSIGLWNNLPASVTSSSTSSSFLASLDRFYQSDKFSFGCLNNPFFKLLSLSL